jgi:hypothetical protein
LNAPRRDDLRAGAEQAGGARLRRSHAAESELLESDKTYSDLAARFALKGFAMYPLGSGGFLIARHNRSAYAPDYQGAANFLLALEGGPTE